MTATAVHFHSAEPIFQGAGRKHRAFVKGVPEVHPALNQRGSQTGYTPSRLPERPLPERGICKLRRPNPPPWFALGRRPKPYCHAHSNAYPAEYRPNDPKRRLTARLTRRPNSGVPQTGQYVRVGLTITTETIA